MKYMAIILLFALQAQAEQLVCELKGAKFLTITGLSETAASHRVTVQFQEAPQFAIASEVLTLKTEKFVDWKGEHVEMLRRIKPEIIPYTTSHFSLELKQIFGGHCADFGCHQSAVFFGEGQGDTLDCQSSKFINKPDPAPFDPDDGCYADCGRSCLEKPIFCGKW